MREQIVIENDTVKHLFKQMKDVKFHFYSGESIGDFKLLNLRVNVIPFYDDNILLMRHMNEDRQVYAKIPNRIVTLPEFIDYTNVKENFQQILVNNAYISLVDVYSDPDDVMDWFHDGPLGLHGILGTKGLNVSLTNHAYFYAFYDEDDEWDKPWRISHCVDIFVYVSIYGSRISDDWVIVPKKEFESYYNSKYPEAYISTFTDIDEYDEEDLDFRMNKDGKKRIHNAFSCLDEIKNSMK